MVEIVRFNLLRFLIMSIPKKQREFFVSLMEATNNGDTPVIYEAEKDAYHGEFNSVVVDKLKDLGAILVVEGALGKTVLINEREDFLSGFAAGALAARNGDDQYMCDYQSNPYSFSCGYEHYQHRQKKCQKTPYKDATGYVCHGFISIDTDLVHRQS